MANLSLKPCQPGDVPEMMHIMTRSFQHDAPFVDTFYPNHDTPEGHEKAIKNFTAMWNSYPSGAHLMKAVLRSSDGSEQIAGFALWTHMAVSQNLPPEEMADVSFAETEDDKRFAKQLWASYVVPRREVIFEMDRKHGKGIWVLEFLCVDPQHQRKGAGSLLVNFGKDNAREEKTDAIVESTVAGEPCYRSCNFTTQWYPMKFDVDEDLRNRDLPDLYFMRQSFV